MSHIERKSKGGKVCRRRGRRRSWYWLRYKCQDEEKEEERKGWVQWWAWWCCSTIRPQQLGPKPGEDP